MEELPEGYQRKSSNGKPCWYNNRIKRLNERRVFKINWKIRKKIIKKYSNPYSISQFFLTIHKETTREGDNKETKKVKKSEQVNQATALWRVPKHQLKRDDYIEFYNDTITWR